jgi:hypothetical protein
MHQTGTFFGIEDNQHASPKSPGEEKFLAAIRKYRKFDADKQSNWCQATQRRLPRLIDVVEAMR